MSIPLLTKSLQTVKVCRLCGRDRQNLEPFGSGFEVVASADHSIALGCCVLGGSGAFFCTIIIRKLPIHCVLTLFDLYNKLLTTMGAWDYGIFDDDAAYEFTDDIKDDPREFFKSSFEHALGQEYLDYDECHAVTVSAAYMDNLLNGTQYRTDSVFFTDEANVNLFGTLHKGLDVSDLKPLAVRALQRVLAENSELNELWSENEELYPKWKQGIVDIIERLRS